MTRPWTDWPQPGIRHLNSRSLWCCSKGRGHPVCNSCAACTGSSRAIRNPPHTKNLAGIPHAELLTSVARRIVDRRVLHLIKMWLECAVEETDDRGRKTRTRLHGEVPIVQLSPKLGSYVIERLASIAENHGAMRAVAESLSSPKRYRNAAALQEDAAGRVPRVERYLCGPSGGTPGKRQRQPVARPIGQRYRDKGLSMCFGVQF
jgi:hypothetical protein